jgi:hypothetical protein
MAAVTMEERKWALASIIERGLVVYYSARQKQFNLEHFQSGPGEI